MTVCEPTIMSSASRLPYDEWLALHTVARETIDRLTSPSDLGSPGYGRPSTLTTHMVNTDQIELVTDAADPNIYRARLTTIGKRVLATERARVEAEA